MADLKYGDIPSIIAQLEGKNSETHIDNIREILALIAKLEAVYRYQVFERSGDEADLRKMSKVLRAIGIRATLVAQKHAKKQKPKKDQA
jgi:ribosomal protein L12E/L44/L45/RPP1/RPP2